MYYDIQASANRIRSLRCKSGLSQEQAAEKMNIDRSYLSRIENGVKGCSVDLFVRMSELYHVSLDFLVLGQVNSQLSLREDIEQVIQQLTSIYNQM